MKAFVISLARTPERLAEFHRRNDSTVPYELFPGIEGIALVPQQLVSAGYFDGSVSYTPGATGNALSHIKLWESIAASEHPATIIEDDAILHRQFAERSEQLMAKLGADWDLVAWGWNFDSILVAELLPLGRCLFAFDQTAMRRGAEQYAQSDANPSLYKLLKAFGTVCYTISPRGARRLLGKILPIRRMDLSVPGVNGLLPNVALDVALNHFYAELDCFVAFPPLVLTPNDHSSSTVRAAAAPRGS